MNGQKLPAILYWACGLMVVIGCQCKKCENVLPGLIGEYSFVSVDYTANGYGHCTYEYTIGIAEGGNPCKVSIVGMDGWGTNNTFSVLEAKVLTSTSEPGFEINTGQIIDAGNNTGCSTWQYLQVTGKGQRNANLLQVTVTFKDTTGAYDSGPMELTFQAI